MSRKSKIAPAVAARSAPKAPVRPRFADIRAAQEYSGIGRSKLYEKAKEVPGLFKKWDYKTLVDFDVLDQILENLPSFEQA